MESQLKLYHGNRLELLAAALAEVLREPLRSPFAKELIVVQSKGMERWVSLQLATRLGICCNCELPFPNALLRRLYEVVLGETPERSAFDADVMLWRTMNCLPALLERAEFSALRSYVGATAPGSLRWAELSHEIARTFDQYLVYRQDLLLRWEQQEEEHWQALLWRELVATSNEQSPAVLARRFFERLAAGGVDREGLPERISVFGISYLPPLHLHAFAAISTVIPVHLFVMNPCGEYWFDILSEKERHRRLGPSMQDGGPEPEDLHLDSGNSLLASMGAQGRYFLGLAHQLATDTREEFEDPGHDSLLTCVQQGILTLTEPSAFNSFPEAENPAAPSIQVHSCHSPMREVEVLHDRLLDLFERDPGLKPADVLIMTPDIETYAPYIQSVFDAVADESARIPYSISDRSVRRENPFVDVLLTILDLAESRFSAPEVLDLLEKPMVRTAFAIEAADLDLIVGWVQETRIRWAMDDAHRSQLGLPPTRENTWRAGLDRLLLGYALPSKGPSLFCDVLPFDGVEGSEGPVLGKLAAFVEALYEQVRLLETPASLHDWAQRLFHLVERFMSSDEADEVAHDRLRTAIFELSELQQLAGFDVDLELPVIKWLLGRWFDRGGARFGFLSGGVTVCAMLPMRSIPFRVIGLLGMGYAGFPRRAFPLSFDLLAAQPRQGDPSPRDDDRYLFLETLLSAREAVHISYVGQSIQDNSPAPPSVLVSELLDYLERGLFGSREQLMDQIVVRHRLQPFSPHYFTGGRLFSYSSAHCEAARQLHLPEREELRFFDRPLDEPGDSWRTLSLEALCRFFDSPARTLLADRLKLQLAEDQPLVEDTEAFKLAGLDRYWVADELLQSVLRKEPLPRWEAAFRTQGTLPHGVPGDLAFARLAGDVTRFAEEISVHVGAGCLDPLAVELKIDRFVLTGILDTLYQDDMVTFRFGTIRAKDRLRLWIRHLALAALNRKDYPRTALIIGRGKGAEIQALRFEPVTAPLPILIRLLQYYRQGLCEPLPFFPETSLAYVERLNKDGGAAGSALKAARSKWNPRVLKNGERVSGECEKDTYFDFCFGTTEPFDRRFEEMALSVFGPLLEYQREVSL